MRSKYSHSGRDTGPRGGNGLKTIDRRNKEDALDYLLCPMPFAPPQMTRKDSERFLIIAPQSCLTASNSDDGQLGTLPRGENQSIDHLRIDDCPFELEMQSSHMTFSRPRSLLLLVLILYCTRLPCTLLCRAHEAGRDLPTYQSGGDIFRSETNQLAALV